MKTETRIAYFVGCAANYYDPEVGKSAIRVLEKNGLTTVLPDQQCCGVPHLSYGNLQSFRRLAEYNVRSLAQTDTDIVTACPSCALALKHEYPRLLGSPQAEAIAQRSFDIIEYLVRVKERKEFNNSLQPLPLRVAYHTPCHLKVLGEDSIGRRLELLRGIPGISLSRIERGCCGMGGTFGSKGSKYSMSMAIGQPLFEELKEATLDRVTTECPACSWQIQQGTGLTVTHPIRILNQAYES